MTPPANPHDHPAKRAWQSPENAAQYRRSRAPERFKRYYLEEAIIGGWLEGLTEGAVVLDSPCGAGRLVPTLLGRGFRYIGADFSGAMIEQARLEAVGPGVLGFFRADAEHLPVADSSVDCVIIWRLLHHLAQSRTREAMLREAARVTRDRVLVSFHHALSFTALRKFLQRKVLGQKQHGRPITHWRLRREAAGAGLSLVATRSFGKYRSINWFACLTKRAPGE